jgi:hypothetical protein
LREINRVLVANGLPPHEEPETLPRLRRRSRLSGLPYDWPQYLRRAIAFARRAPDKFTPVSEGERPSQHPLIYDELAMLSCHLLCHAPCEGYFVPIDFLDPLFHDSPQEIGGGVLGSSQAAVRELIHVAPLINIRVRNGTITNELAKKIRDERRGQFYIERQVWLELFEEFRLSIKHGTAVAFC